MPSEPATEAVKGGPLLASGQPLHTRTVAVDVFRDEPGLLRAEGEILDLRKVGFVPTGGDLQTAGFIHHMQIQLWLDLASGRIERLEARQPHVPFEAAPATAGESCRDVVPRLQSLVGRPVEEAFHRDLSACFGGPLGCSHLLTLAHAMGSMLPAVLQHERGQSEREAEERVAKRVIFLDGFGAEDGGMGISIQLSDFVTKPRGRVVSTFDRLARQSEVQVRAHVDLGTLALASLEAIERVRAPATMASAEWRDLESDLDGLIGRSALGGMAATLFEQLGGREETRLLLDALLQLAPGLIQCFATRTEDLLRRVAANGGQRQSGDLPGELSLGGTADSCHMWRAGGSMARQRASFEEG